MQYFKTLFAAASTFHDFTAQAEEKDIEALKQCEKLAKAIRNEGELARLPTLQTACNILVVAEMWCPDCHKNLPAIRRVTQLAPHVGLGIVTREQAGEAFMAHFKLEKISIPFAVVLDADFTPLGQFIERPKSAWDEEGKVKESYRNAELLADTAQEIAAILYRAEDASRTV